MVWQLGLKHFLNTWKQWWCHCYIFRVFLCSVFQTGLWVKITAYFTMQTCFWKKVLNVSQYRMTCSEEGFRVEFALSDWILESFFHWFFYILGKQSPGLAFQTRGFHNDLCNFDFGSWHRRWTQSDNVILETTAVKVIIWCPCCLMPTYYYRVCWTPCGFSVGYLIWCLLP